MHANVQTKHRDPRTEDAFVQQLLWASLWPNKDQEGKEHIDTAASADYVKLNGGVSEKTASSRLSTYL